MFRRRYYRLKQTGEDAARRQSGDLGAGTPAGFISSGHPSLARRSLLWASLAVNFGLLKDFVTSRYTMGLPLSDTQPAGP